MPRKASAKLVSQQNSPSYKNLLYGALSVIVLFIIIFLGLRALSQKNGQISPEAGNTAMNETQNVYVVKTGDTLWDIAVAKYNDGYRWPEIAKANNLENPDAIDAGMKLTLPVLTPTPTPAQEAMSAVPSESVEGKITGNAYTVVRGDNLWNIAVRAYGDGYKWVEIAKANKLANPDLIFAGNKFVLPR